MTSSAASYRGADVRSGAVETSACGCGNAVGLTSILHRGLFSSERHSVAW